MNNASPACVMSSIVSMPVISENRETVQMRSAADSSLMRPRFLSLSIPVSAMSAMRVPPRLRLRATGGASGAVSGASGPVRG